MLCKRSLSRHAVGLRVCPCVCMYVCHVRTCQNE